MKFDYTHLTAEQFMADPAYAQNYYVLLADWREAKAALDKYKGIEAKCRQLLVQCTFGDSPTEGTHHHVFGDDKKTCPKLTLTQPMTRTIDPAAIGLALEELRKVIGSAADTVVRFKPDLAVGPYKKLTEEQQLLLAPAITTKPGSPQVKYSEPSA